MNEWVYKQGEDPQYIFFIKEGEFKVSDYDLISLLLTLQSNRLRKKLTLKISLKLKILTPN